MTLGSSEVIKNAIDLRSAHLLPWPGNIKSQLQSTHRLKQIPTRETHLPGWSTNNEAKGMVF
jgi:hypothetical protein